MTLHDPGHFDEPHHQVLEVLCAKALENGDVETAYRLSDRRCRIRPLPDVHAYVLRAEALHRMGDRVAAVADLVTALQIAPDDIAANRRMLLWGRARQRADAARALIAGERDMRVVRQAIAVLRKAGQAAFAGLRIREGVVEGWAAWQGTGPILVSIAGDTDRIDSSFDADPRHPLSPELGRAVNFDLPRPPAAGPQFISVTCDGEVLAELRTTRPSGRPAGSMRPGSGAAGADPKVTVIVPVYADYRATRACLESLWDEIEGSTRYSAVVVNDASPDPRMGELLDTWGGRPNVLILTNTKNLGFVGAINRGLDEIPSDDVVLLNADTIVPVGFIARLSSAARSSPDIGTVTPLSNNGEFTSFPVPNQPNAPSNAAAVRQLDELAARVNTGRVVDIPNGIGFCLYVTRGCLDVVGSLSESYHRGYLEDVDFCLRARQHGFRNVCAASVYVGHAGSRSFRSQKRSLVVRNLAVIEQRFPSYRAECADFILADPLNAARGAIEIGLPPTRQDGILLVSGGGAVAEVARERARQLLAGTAPAVLVLEIRYGPDGPVASLCDATDGVPQSLAFKLPHQVSELSELLRRSQLARMEFLDLARIPRAAIDALLGLSVPYDLFVAHAELLSAQITGRAMVHALHADRAMPDLAQSRKVAAGADRVLAPDAQAAAAALALGLRRSVTRLDVETRCDASPTPLRGKAERLGLVPVRGCAWEQRFMHGVIAGLRRAVPDIETVVVGGTPDDRALFRAGRAFVTGPVDAAELDVSFRRYRLDRVLCCLMRPLFGHPIPAAMARIGMPMAYVDWSHGSCPARNGDLPLDVSLSPAAVVARLTPWLREPSPQ